MLLETILFSNVSAGAGIAGADPAQSFSASAATHVQERQQKSQRRTSQQNFEPQRWLRWHRKPAPITCGTTVHDAHAKPNMSLNVSDPPAEQSFCKGSQQWKINRVFFANKLEQQKRICERRTSWARILEQRIFRK